MARLVGICVVLFVLAAGFLIVAAGADVAALFNALWAAPFLEKLAWAILVLVPLVMLPAAVWLCDTLVRQRKAAAALELRLDGVRQGVRDLARSQVDAEAAVHQLARTDPEDAIGAIQQRLTEAERAADVQQKRNEIGDLQSRVDSIRLQQQALQARLVPVLEKRRAIDQLFLELDTNQTDIGRSLAEITNGDDAVALDLRLKKLKDFAVSGNERCDDIENASQTAARLKEEYATLHERLTPFAVAKDGITARMKDLHAARDKLSGEIEALQRTPEGPLAEQVQNVADDTAQLGSNVSELNEQFSKLAVLRKDIAGLLAKLETGLDVVVVGANGRANADINDRIAEFSTFLEATQDHLGDLEDKTAAFDQLKAKLTDLQSRVAPLESHDNGVISLVGQVQEIRDRLVAKIDRLEADDNGDLATRVKTFTEARRELEERVSIVTDHFSQLATVRKDLAGLFEKLSSAAATSSNGSS